MLELMFSFTNNNVNINQIKTQPETLFIFSFGDEKEIINQSLLRQTQIPKQGYLKNAKTLIFQVSQLPWLSSLRM